jgi:transcription elongation factor SPT5
LYDCCYIFESNVSDSFFAAKRDDGLIGKTVRIQAGQWKGYLGTVCDATATHVQVELHSRLKKIMVVRERVAVAGDKFGATEDGGRTVPDPSSMMAPTTPFVSGGATPMHGGATPLHGGATPMHDSEGGDEVWRPGGSIDQGPAHQVDDGWGPSVLPEEQNNPFGSPVNEVDNGWGSSTAAWAPPAPEQQQQQEDTSSFAAPSAIKREKDMEEADMTDEAATAVWFMERVCVSLKNDGALAVIKEISDKLATVELENKSTKQVRVGDVSMVPPKEHDMVLVTGGADVGVEGELVCIDGTDAILKDSNEDFKIVDFVHLAKIVGDA